MGKIATRIALTIAAILTSAPALILTSWPYVLEVRQQDYLWGVPYLIWAGFLSLICLGIVALIAIVIVRKHRPRAS